ncbi:MAG: sulfite exporter TauE/SafE family protein [Actinomycetes bacterium]
MMWLILAFAVAGGAAQLVDGTLGMGFGVTSATLLLAFGVSPVAASAATHAAKLPTTLVSGLAHWRQGNVDRRVMLRLALPGAVGAFLGAVVLTGLSLSSAKAWMAALLLFFGVVIFLRFGFGIRVIPTPRNGDRARWLVPIGGLGGFVDATGGGGWGPVVTPSMFTVTTREPRMIVGTVNAAEFVVALAASAGFLTGAAHEDIPWLPVLGLVVGGMLVAPFAARLAGRLPHSLMGTLVGGLILIVNGSVIIKAVTPVPGWLGWLLVLGAVAGTSVVAVRAWRLERDARATEDVTAAGTVIEPMVP